MFCAALQTHAHWIRCKKAASTELKYWSQNASLRTPDYRWERNRAERARCLVASRQMRVCDYRARSASSVSDRSNLRVACFAGGVEQLCHKSSLPAEPIQRLVIGNAGNWPNGRDLAARAPPKALRLFNSFYEDPRKCRFSAFLQNWCQKRDRDVSTKRGFTTLYCGFLARDTVENTVSASALVLNEDSNHCGHLLGQSNVTPI